MGNGPSNYEAMAHAYTIALLFTCSKVSMVCCVVGVLIAYKDP